MDTFNMDTFNMVHSIWYSHKMEYYGEVKRNGLDQYVNMESSQKYVEWEKNKFQNDTHFGTLMQILTMHFKSYTYFYGYT